jgi:fumarate hydratase subunit alpha
MKVIPYQKIVDTVADMSITACSVLSDDVYKRLEWALNKEESPVGKAVLQQIIDNDNIAKEETNPMCQDTGIAVFYVELGDQIQIEGNLTQAITDGVIKGYKDGYLRKSMVKDPLDRANTGDNTPPIIHYEIVPGDALKLTIAPKGGGSENMSRARLFAPAVGREGIKKFVVETVDDAKGNPCPPTVVGVGVGGNFEKSALIAKKSLLRPMGSRHPDEFWSSLEDEILEEINKLGIGPMGLGGTITSLDVHIETHPCHIASLPVAVNIQCHAARHKSVTL